jgi:hypothetical protein
MPDNAIFGHSLKMVDGDLVMQDRSLVEISGQNNLLQALVLRILTPFGSDIFNTSYGLDIREAFTKPNSVPIVKELIKLNLVRTLGMDSRVRDIRDIIFEDDPEYRARHPEISPEQVRDDRHRRSWKVDVILDTADNQTQTLTANIGV